MDTKFLVEAPETIDYIPGETQLPNSREYVEKTRITLSTAGFGGPTMLDRMIEQMTRRAGQKMFLSYIYGIDPVEVCRDYIRQTWEIFSSPLWSETLYRVRPIVIRKGGWGFRRRTRLGSIPAHGAETQRSIQ